MKISGVKSKTVHRGEKSFAGVGTTQESVWIVMSCIHVCVLYMFMVHTVFSVGLHYWTISARECSTWDQYMPERGTDFLEPPAAALGSWESKSLALRKPGDRLAKDTFSNLSRLPKIFWTISDSLNKGWSVKTLAEVSTTEAKPRACTITHHIMHAHFPTPWSIFFSLAVCGGPECIINRWQRFFHNKKIPAGDNYHKINAVLTATAANTPKLHLRVCCQSFTDKNRRGAGDSKEIHSCCPSSYILSLMLSM